MNELTSPEEPLTLSPMGEDYQCGYAQALRDMKNLIHELHLEDANLLWDEIGKLEKNLKEKK